MTEERWSAAPSNDTTFDCITQKSEKVADAEKIAVAEAELDLDEDGVVVLDMMPTLLQFKEDEVDHCAAMGSGSHVYVEEWNGLFKSSNYPSMLTNHAFQGELRSCRFRSVCWKVFLHCLPHDQAHWTDAAKASHEHYERLKSNFIINPRNDGGILDPLVNNPLSQEESSPWNQYFQDSELKLTIQQDVLRTFPEIEFFQSSYVRGLMINILFCYAREHPEISYRQGMHELLAPLVFVLHSDQQAFLHAVEIEFVDYFNPLERETVRFILDPEYLEHDSYCMFNKLMQNVESWYIIREENSFNQFTLGCVKPFPRPQDANVYTVVISKLNNIHDSLLKRHDQELYNYLERMEIAPQIFGIRWLRLLFGREFALQDLLVIWDVIFADGRNFDLVDYIFISMLEYIKPSLLNSDYANCLGFLMRYPAIADIHYIIDLALHIREPLKYKKPKGHNHHTIHHVPTVGGRPDIHRSPMFQKPNSIESKDLTKGKTGNKVMSGISSLTRKMSITRPTTLRVNSSQRAQSPSVRPKQRPSKSSSEPNSTESHSPSPDLAEYAQIDADFDQDTACAARSIPPFAKSTSPMKAETEMRPMRSGFVQDRAATLPRSYKRDESATIDSVNYVNGIAVFEESHSLSQEQLLNRRGSLKNPSRNKKYSTKQSIINFQQEVDFLQGRLNEYESMCAYCSLKMTTHIERLQDCFLKQTLENEDKMLIALAGIKQVRDILKGTLKFSRNLLDVDDFGIDDEGGGGYSKEKHERANSLSYDQS